MKLGLASVQFYNYRSRGLHSCSPPSRPRGTPGVRSSLELPLLMVKELPMDGRTDVRVLGTFCVGLRDRVAVIKSSQLRVVGLRARVASVRRTPAEPYALELRGLWRGEA